MKASTASRSVPRARSRVAAFASMAFVALIITAAVGAAPAVAALPASCVAPTAQPSGEAIDLSATIIGPACDGSGSASGSGAGSPGGASVLPPRSSNSIGGTGSATVAPPAASSEVTVDEIDLAGMLSVGGLSTVASPSLNPFGGELQMWFTVRNSSTSTIDATADFWMDGWFGNRISSADGVQIAGLKPGETRTVSAAIPGVGQWSIVNAHVTFTPPSELDGATLAPLTRDATVFAFPWLVAAILAVALAARAVVLVARRRESFAPHGATA